MLALELKILSRLLACCGHFTPESKDEQREVRGKRTLPVHESCAWHGHHASLRLHATTQRTDVSTY